MATKKKATKRRSKKALSAKPRRRNRKRGMSSKGMLADILNPTIAMHSAKQTMAAVGGGMGAVITNKVILPPTAGKLIRVSLALGVGFLASSLGMPSVGAGYAGGMMALTFQNGLMADDDNAKFANDNSLNEDTPLF